MGTEYLSRGTYTAAALTSILPLFKEHQRDADDTEPWGDDRGRRKAECTHAPEERTAERCVILTLRHEFL